MKTYGGVEVQFHHTIRGVSRTAVAMKRLGKDVSGDIATIQEVLQTAFSVGPLRGYMT
jgi:hypothetical protein